MQIFTTILINLPIELSELVTMVDSALLVIS